MDMSDGLADAVRQIAAASGIGAASMRPRCRSPTRRGSGSSAPAWIRLTRAVGRRRRLRAALRGAEARARPPRHRHPPVARHPHHAHWPAHQGAAIVLLSGTGCRNRCRRVSSTSNRCSPSSRTRRWLDQLLHTHDTPQRTAAGVRARRVLRVLAVPRPAHRPGAGVRVCLQPESGRGPARDLLEPALDPAGLLLADHPAGRGNPGRPGSAGPLTRSSGSAVADGPGRTSGSSGTP